MKKLILILLLCTSFTYVFAQAPTGASSTGGAPTGNSEGVSSVVNPLSIPDVPALLAAILNIIVQLAVPFLVLAMMYVGFLFVAARGVPEKIAQARTALWYTLLGALIILGAKTLATILSSTIGQLVNTQ